MGSCCVKTSDTQDLRDKLNETSESSKRDNSNLNSKENLQQSTLGSKASTSLFRERGFYLFISNVNVGRNSHASQKSEQVEGSIV